MRDRKPNRQPLEPPGEVMRGWRVRIDSDQFVPNPPGFRFPWSVAALCGGALLVIVLLAVVVEFLGG